MSRSLSDVEIIEIVDFVRSIRSQPLSIEQHGLDGAMSSRLSPMSGFEPDQPILSIIRREDGKIEVTTGELLDLVAGHGAILALEKAGGQWKAISCGRWKAPSWR